MAIAHKSCILALMLIFVSLSMSLLIIKLASAESIPTPATPQFTLRYNKASYSIADPYTGASQQVDNSTIDIIIRNQPFNIICDAKANTNTSLYYNVQVKGHYTENWTDAFTFITYSYRVNDHALTWFNYPTQSNSDYTTISLPANYPVDTQVDVRVQAVIANQSEIIIPDVVPLRGNNLLETWMFIVQTSGWGPTQTITIHSQDQPASSATPSASHGTQTPLATETSSGNPLKVDWMQTATLVLLGTIVVLLVLVVVYLRKRAAPKLR